MSISATPGNSSPSPAPTNGTDNNGAAIHPFSQDLPAIRASQLSAAFASISEQLAQASDIFAGYQSASSSAQNLIGGKDNGQSEAHDGVQEEGRLTPELESLHARLDAIERTQSVLSNDVESIKAQIESEHTRVSTPVPSTSNGASTAALPPAVAASNEKIEELEKKMKEMADTIKLELVLSPTRWSKLSHSVSLIHLHHQNLTSAYRDIHRQDRLYARLHNATASVSKMPIMAPPTANGKPLPNFPATKGEFEHLTSCVTFHFRFLASTASLSMISTAVDLFQRVDYIGERYEALLKAYGQPLLKAPGPLVDARRQALRVFIGLPA